MIDAFIAKNVSKFTDKDDSSFNLKTLLNRANSRLKLRRSFEIVIIIFASCTDSIFIDGEINSVRMREVEPGISPS
jgi:hypothetical protein